MIAIVSNAPRERAAFAALCASRGWASTECDSLRALRKLLRRTRPRIVLTRHRLGDGYSDDVLVRLANAGGPGATRVIVLIGAGTPSSLEARQVALGADLVQHDPVRTEVLLEYLAKYRVAAQRQRVATPRAGPRPFRFAGATVHPVDRQLRRKQATIRLTPREVDLVESLAQSAGEVVTYETLYSEILGRRFRGDTSNMRVLLGKLAASFRSVGLVLRASIEVIPKSGYRYRPPGSR